MNKIKTRSYARPGHPDGAHPLAILAYLGALFVAGLLGWALLAGAMWLVWTYTLVVLSYVVALSAVVLVAWLVLKGGWRPRAGAIALFAALVSFVAVVARG